jgi:malate dehydrogenase (oxaloacetate-decarboxylating)(NADP+)
MPDQEIRAASLEYHRQYPPGKISVQPTKHLTNQRDLALAYTPAWRPPATRSSAIRPRPQPHRARQSGRRRHQRHGRAGTGRDRSARAQAVMEGKAVLFKKFAGIDCFDIEIDERDPEKLVDIIAALEPTFGGINLEDIKAPECFYVERKLRERLKIPVFHDDQHGTAIIVGAAILNGLRVVGKELSEVKLVCSGAGAAALACLDSAGAARHRPEEHLGRRHRGRRLPRPREEMDDNKARYAQPTEARKLVDILTAPMSSSAFPRPRC